jgi:hypothetical protein
MPAHGQLDALELDEVGELRDVVGRDGHALGDLRNAGIARRAEQLRRQFALG